MTRREHLPDPRSHYGSDGPECPWCGGFMYGFAPPWSEVMVLPDPSGHADLSLVSVDGDCPDCGKPVRVIERRGGDTLWGHTEGRLTATDERYLSQKQVPA